MKLVTMIGQTVVFVGAPAEVSDPDGHLCVPNETKISGLYVVDDFLPYEPSAYVHEAGFIVADADTVMDNGVSFFVTVDEFEKQVWPRSYGRAIVQEREAEAANETRRCVGCFNEVRPGCPEDHSRGCPTGQNGTPNYE